MRKETGLLASPLSLEVLHAMYDVLFDYYWYMENCLYEVDNELEKRKGNPCKTSIEYAKQYLEMLIKAYKIGEYFDVPTENKAEGTVHLWNT